MSDNYYACLALVLVAAVLEIIANLLLAKSEGFSKKGYGIVALVLVGLSFTGLALATRGMDLAVAYALWGGFGIIGTSIGGWLLFGQKLKGMAWGGIVMLLGGMILLH